jgi:transcriptional regulator with XRE-family HTH domain
VPRRTTPNPLAKAVGRRIRDLREEAELTLEKLAWESDLGKGHLSDIEKGLAVPNILSLQRIADRLGTLLVDLVNFPEKDDRQKLVERSRRFSVATIRAILKQNPGK